MVVKDKSEQLLYVDGIFVGRTLLSRIAPPPLGWLPDRAYLGAARDHTRFLDGLIDELAFYNRALSAAEIKEVSEMTLRRPCALAPSPILAPSTQFGDIAHPR
jgi:hypothetical protein